MHGGMAMLSFPRTRAGSKRLRAHIDSPEPVPTGQHCLLVLAMKSVIDRNYPPSGGTCNSWIIMIPQPNDHRCRLCAVAGH